MNAKTRARVEEGFRRIADSAELSRRNDPGADIYQLVHDWLSNQRNGQWAMVLDSADDRDVFFETSGNNAGQRRLADYLPQSSHGSILVTTRSRDLALRLTGHHRNIIDIGPMTEQEALILLESRLGPLSDITVATKLVQALELIPLAISQAGAYIRQRARRTSVQKYLAEFKEGERTRIKLLAHDAGDIYRDGAASNSILTTWRLSFERIRLERPSAADLLALMSFFNRRGIPEEVLKHKFDTEDSGSDSGDDQTDGALEDDVTFEDDVAMLEDYCLVTADKTGHAFEMHELVQLSTRRWLKGRGLEERFKHDYIQLMAEALPKPRSDNWATYEMLFCHFEALIDHRPVRRDMEMIWATLLFNGGLFAAEKRNYGTAEPMLRLSRIAHAKLLGEEENRTASVTSLYAEVLIGKGRLQDAEELLARSLEILKLKVGPNHHQTLRITETLATVYLEQGRPEEAQDLRAHVLTTLKDTVGDRHRDTWRAMHNLATLYTRQGQLKEATKLNLEVLEAYKSRFGDQHPNTLIVKDNLACTLGAQGLFEQARKLFQEVLEVRTTVFGANHFHTLTTMNNLATTLAGLDLVEEAEALVFKVFETSKASFGLGDTMTLSSMHNLAVMWSEQGRHTDALRMMRECAEGRLRLLGPRHHDTLTALKMVEDWSGD